MDFRLPVMLVGILLLLTGCSGNPAAGTVMDIRGRLPQLQFRLQDDDGRSVGDTTFRGEPVVLYFGYSGCGDQCPLTLARLTRIAGRARFRVLFVSVDPLDRTAVLHAFVGNYAPLDIHGLSGPPADIAALARRCRAAYGVPDHAAALYVFDSQGQARFLVTPRVEDGDLVAALREAADV